MIHDRAHLDARFTDIHSSRYSVVLHVLESSLEQMLSFSFACFLPTGLHESLREECCI